MKTIFIYIFMMYKSLIGSALKCGIFCLFINFMFADSIISFSSSESVAKKQEYVDTKKTASQSSTKQNDSTKPKVTESNKENVVKENIVFNGKTFVAITNDSNVNKLKLGNKTYEWLKHPKNPNKKIAIIGINYHSKLGIVDLGSGFKINIKNGNYRQEKITITNKATVKPDTKASQRIEKELEEANKIYRTYTNTRYWSGKFELPMNSKITSPYGSARVYNGEVKSFHAGTDFRASIGTPITAINDGVVVLSKHRFLSGKSVIVSHGEGIFSMYYHGSELKVKVGDKVKKGDIISLSGDTGRVSGPHLHLSVMVNGILVDPIDFIESMNKLFD